MARFNDFIANDYRARRAFGEKDPVYDNVRLFALFEKAFRRLRLTLDTFEEYRADLRRAGYLTLAGGEYSYHPVALAKIRSRPDRIRGQNCDLSNFSHESHPRPLKTKSLPAQPGGPRPRNAQGRFCKSAPADAVFQGLPSQEAGFLDVEAGSFKDPPKQRAVENLPDAHASQRPQPVTLSDSAIRDAYRLLGISVPDDASSQDFAAPRPLDALTVCPPNDDTSRPEEENLPNAHASGKPEEAKAQPGVKADEDFDFAAALERLRQPVVPQEYVSRPIVERVPERPKAKEKKVDTDAPKATHFFNDNQQVTQDFYNYTMRTVPGLQRVRWQTIQYRQYPIRIWRMAVAGLLAVWPGQIHTTPERFLVNLASLLKSGQRQDPRRQRGYRLVRRCAVSEEFAGVAEFRVSQDKMDRVEADPLGEGDDTRQQD